MNRDQQRARLNAYRYLMHHLQAGIPRGDWKWDRDVRTQAQRALMGGMILATLVVVVVGVIAAISPSRGIHGSELVLSKNSGQMYVQAEGRLHPVSGLAAARLVLGQAVKPTEVTDKDIAKLPQGTPWGITQGPRALPEDAGHWDTYGETWAMCDYAEPTSDQYFHVRATMLVGAVKESPLDHMRPASMLAVHGENVWLLRDGQRRKVTNIQRSRALQLGARVVSAALLNSLVEMPPRKLSSVPFTSVETTLCAMWRVTSGEATPQLSIRVGNIDAQWKHATDLTQQDGEGDNVDAFLLVGRRAVVGYAAQLVGGGAVHSVLPGSEEAAQRQVDLWLVSDDGVRYATQKDVLPVLGVGTETMPLPWAMISQISSGPALLPSKTTTGRRA